MSMKSDLSKVYAKLSMVDQMKLNGYINMEVENETRKEVERNADLTDYCYIAALIEKCEDLTKEEIVEIINNGMKLKEEQIEVVMKIKKEYGKGIDEYVEKSNEKVKARVKQLVEDNVNQAKAIKTLKGEFKDVPPATLITYYKDYKDGYKAQQKELNTTIVEDNKNTDLEVAAAYVCSDIKPLSQREEPAKETSLFKIKNKTIELEGNFDEYKVDNDKLIVRNVEYTSIEDIEETFGYEINAIAKELEIARNRLLEAKQVFNEFIK